MLSAARDNGKIRNVGLSNFLIHQVITLPILELVSDDLTLSFCPENVQTSKLNQSTREVKIEFCCTICSFKIMNKSSRQRATRAPFGTSASATSSSTRFRKSTFPHNRVCVCVCVGERERERARVRARVRHGLHPQPRPQQLPHPPGLESQLPHKIESECVCVCEIERARVRARARQRLHPQLRPQQLPHPPGQSDVMTSSSSSLSSLTKVYEPYIRAFTPTILHGTVSFEGPLRGFLAHKKPPSP